MSKFDNHHTNYEIVKVRTEYQFNEIRVLFSEYQKELGKDLSFQRFEAELENLASVYNESGGELLLLMDLNDEEYVGCIGLKKLNEGKCEMKRLYVKPAYRSKKYGRRLVDMILLVARDLQYQEMWLDTLKELIPAINLYKKLGFVETKAYYDNPYDDVIYMKKLL